MPIKKEIPEVNTGSMADIAFLLLIFFLVTTTLETNEGISRLLPPDDNPPEIEVYERNVFRVQLNDQDELLVEGEVSNANFLKEQAIAFLDNGGQSKDTPGYCAYCKGKGLSDSSDNPIKAIMYLTHTRATSYGRYVAVQNQLVAAYNELRNRESHLVYGEGYTAMVDRFNDDKTTSVEKGGLKKRIKRIQERYPQKIIEGNNTFKNVRP